MTLRYSTGNSNSSKCGPSQKLRVGQVRIYIIGRIKYQLPIAVPPRIYFEELKYPSSFKWFNSGFNKPTHNSCIIIQSWKSLGHPFVPFRNPLSCEITPKWASRSCEIYSLSSSFLVPSRFPCGGPQHQHLELRQSLGAMWHQIHKLEVIPWWHELVWKMNEHEDILDTWREELSINCGIFAGSRGCDQWSCSHLFRISFKWLGTCNDEVWWSIYTVPYYPTSKYPNAPHSPLAPKMDDKKTIQ